MTWLLLIWACGPTGGEERPDTGDIEVEKAWSLDPVHVVSSRIEGSQGVLESFRSVANDWAYLLDPSGEAIHTVTGANVQPRGSYCVGGEGEGEDCTGVLRNPGYISTNLTLHACLDALEHRIALVQDKGRVELVGGSSSTEHWRHENSVYEVWQPPPDAVAGLVGPCFWTDGQLWLSGGGYLVAVEGDEQGYLWVQSHVVSAGFRQLEPLGNERVVGWGVDGRAYIVNLSDGALEELPTGDAVIQDLVVDRTRRRLWIADSVNRQLMRFDLVEEKLVAAGAWPTRDLVTELVVDEPTGALGTLEIDESGRSWLGLYAEHGLQDRAALEGQALSLVPPAGLRQLAVVSRLGDGELAWQVWAIGPPEDPRPPLGVFAITTLEEPFLNTDMPCAAAAEDEVGFAELVETLRLNIATLDSVRIPVAVGVTWEFVSKAVECGEEGVLDEMNQFDFELGHMVHSRPCFNCTDGEVEGLFVVECGPSSPHYLLADDSTACWPDHTDYCELGDTDCWAALVGQRALEVDEVLPGGAAFIFGADRHGLWGWDWVSGYRNFERADGSQGYPLSLFAGRWAYPEIGSFDDPRGKEPAPLLAEDIGKPWFISDLDSWGLDSAFSDLLYLPGHSVALIKVGEHQATGLHLLHLANSELSIGLDRTDMHTISGLLHQAVAHRDEKASGSWYLHIRDLSSWRLDEPGDDGLSAMAHLSRWKAEVEETFDANQIQWMLPSEIRTRREAPGGGYLDE
jgi:hypothetical protein